MTRRWLPDITLIALIVSCFIQVGAQLFAVSIIARVVQSAPPRSFAILEGPYRYDSSAFWNIVPPITALLFIIALIGNWKTNRRTLIVGAFALFLVSGVVAGVYVEPMYAQMIAVGYRDVVDPELQARAARWYSMDFAIWALGLVAGIALLCALARPTASLSSRKR
ncbi:MAG TPA: hypothetical protein VF042_16405 [Gemmatimonadaceae bacterium]